MAEGCPPDEAASVQVQTADSLIRSWPGSTRGPSAHGLDPWAPTRPARVGGGVGARIKSGHERLGQLNYPNEFEH
jgi:hypothetical protein